MIFNPNNSFTAKIAVTFLPGGYCTCSNGAITLTSPNTSGNCTFTVHAKGNWTINDGMQSAVINVSQQGTTYSSNIRKRVLLRSGHNEHERINYYGEVVRGAAPLTYGSGDSFVYEVYHLQYSWSRENAFIDLSRYSKYVLTLSIDHSMVFDNYMKIWYSDGTEASVTMPDWQLKTYTIDLTNVNKLGKPGFMDVTASGGGTQVFRVQDIYLE